MYQQIMFYRGKDRSGDIASSAMVKIKQNWEMKHLNVEFINLDKRNGEKYLKKLFETVSQKDVKLHIMDDEEIFLEFLMENYPEVKIETFNTATYLPAKNNRSSWSNEAINFAEKLFSEYKSALGETKMWVCKWASTKIADIESVEVSNYDLKNKKTEYNKCYFESEAEAIAHVIKNIEEAIIQKEAALKTSQAKIKELKKELKKYKPANPAGDK